MINNIPGGARRAGVFKARLSRLNSSPIEVVATTLEFGRIEPSDLAKRLELEKHGEERGKRNEPSSKAASFDSIEHTIISEIESYRRNAVDRLTRSLESYSARLQSFDFLQVRVDLISALSRAKADFIAEVHQGENELFQKRRAVLGTTRDVDEFRAAHGIKRLYHPPLPRVWTLGLLLFLLLIEALPINGALFAGGLPGGFSEGMAIAAGIAFLNVAVGFAAGLCVVRFLLYKSAIIRVCAAIALLTDFVFCVGLNLGVARFRSALNTLDPEAALSSMFGVPFLEVIQHLTDITGFQSYILVGVGIMFHVTTIADGFKFDDPYPFYGKFWRKRERAETEYAQTSEYLIAYLTEKRDETIDEIQTASRTLASSRRIAARISENRQAALARFSAYIDSLERTANQLLTLYREENQSNRSAPAPAHFIEEWQFSDRPSMQGQSNDKERWADDDVARRTQEDLEKGIAEVGQHYVTAVTTYKKIRTMVDEELSDAQAVRTVS